MNPADFGCAVIHPDGAFPVAKTGTWRITFTAGKYGIDDGGSIIIVRRAMSDAVMPQCADPNAPGYVTAETDGNAVLDVFYDNRYWIRPHRGAIVIRVFDGSIKEGDTIIVSIGDRSGQSPGWRLQTFPEAAHTFKILVDAFGTREYYEIPDHPFVTIVPGEPSAIEAVLPSSTAPGTEVSVFIRITDAWGNPVRFYNGKVNLHYPKNCHGDGSSFFMRKGVERAGIIRFTEEGIYSIGVSADGFDGKSNPIVVSENASSLYWGDMHGQTEHTVGTGTVKEYFSFARDSALIDVAGWQGNDFQVTDTTWEEVCEETRVFHEPGKFITFLGYEWSGLTPAGGDHNILFLGDDQPIHRSSHWQIHDGSSEETDCYPLSALWDAFRDRTDVMAIAHVGGRYANFDYWDEEFSGLVEIHSHHGTFEWFAEDALSRGLIAGFVGQSDDHTGRPGLSAPLRPLARDFATFDVYGGYTGIYADELTRESVWDALKARHCYATTGCRIYLDVRATDSTYMMGDIVERGLPVDFSIQIAGTAPLLDLEVRRNMETIHRHPFPLDENDTWVRVEWSGVRIRSRAKTADWDGRIRVKNGKIDDFRMYAFDRKDQGVTKVNDHELNIVSTTSGDIDGVFMKISGEAPVVGYKGAGFTCEASVDDLNEAPMRFDAGGVNCAMSFSLCSPFNRPEMLSLGFRDDNPPSGRNAYWIKVVQIDGNMAWSSPLYFEKE